MIGDKTSGIQSRSLRTERRNLKIQDGVDVRRRPASVCVHQMFASRSKSIFPCLYILINVNIRDEIKIINLCINVCDVILILYLYIFHLLSKYWDPIQYVYSDQFRIDFRSRRFQMQIFPHVTKYDIQHEKSFSIELIYYNFAFRHGV